MVSERFNAVRLVKMRCEEHATKEKLTETVLKLTDLQLTMQRIRAFMEGIVQLIVIASIFLTFYLAVEYMQKSLASITLFSLLIVRCSPLVSLINTNRLLISSALASFNRVETVLENATRQEALDQGVLEFQQLHNGLDFIDVSFDYEKDGRSVEALKNVSLSIHKGQMVAFVGPSGAGKSTAADLIARFFSPSSGQVCVDGTPVEQFTFRSFRRKIAYVTQEAIMFHDTVRNNLLFGLGRTVSDEQLWQSLERSYSKTFVESWPRGLDTIIGERGLAVSGGQRQRLALARALLQKPELLILDESTSALDSATEAQIYASLQALRGKITIIVIAHRSSIIQDADRIFVFDRGELVAQGGHKELLSQKGIYHKLVIMQQL